MRILWHSSPPFSSSGYGVTCKTFVSRIEALGHTVAVSARGGLARGVIPWSPTIVIFPMGTLAHGIGILGATASRIRADAVISHDDIWALTTQVVAALPRWCPWTPIDTADCPPIITERLRVAHRPIAMSRHGESAMARAGVESTYIPHGYDKASFFPMPQSEARALLGWGADRFVVVSVGVNSLGQGVPNRKCPDEQIGAFAMLRRVHSDALLYWHGDAYSGGASDMIAIAERHGLVVGRDVLFPDPHDLQLGLPTEYMRALYSAADVLLSVSAGEGFGIPCIEAQACGTPIIGGDWSATAELVGPGWRVERSESREYWIDLWQSTWRLPYPEAIAERLEAAYSARGDAALRQRCASFAAAFDADHVTATYWKPFLDELAESGGLAVSTNGKGQHDAHAAE